MVWNSSLVRPPRRRSRRSSLGVAEERGDESLASGAPVDAGNQGSVELEIGGLTGDLAQARVAGADVVDGQFAPRRRSSADGGVQLGGLLDECVLGQLDDQTRDVGHIREQREGAWVQQQRARQVDAEQRTVGQLVE